jgi:hypothetical protein
MMKRAMPHVTLEEAQAAKKTARRLFETVGSVIGVGITRLGGEYAVKVNLSGPIAPGTEVPTEIDGVPVRVEVTGSIRAR